MVLEATLAYFLALLFFVLLGIFVFILARSQTAQQNTPPSAQKGRPE